MCQFLCLSAETVKVWQETSSEPGGQQDRHEKQELGSAVLAALPFNIQMLPFCWTINNYWLNVYMKHLGKIRTVDRSQN